MAEKIIADKGELFKELHHNGKLLVLPNVWNSLSAILLESLGYNAVATASASIALTNGFPDGEKIPFNHVITLLKQIVNSVSIPVSADIESGYAENNDDLKEHIKQLIDTGIAGINFEDSKHDVEGLIPVDKQSEKIALIREIAREKNLHLFINARTDVLLKKSSLTEDEKLKEIIKRGKAYKDAGADGFYPMVLTNGQHIEKVIKEVGLPVNIIMIPGIPEFTTLQQIGLARISLGPGFLKIAINGMKNIAEKLIRYEGMNEVISNPVTGNYLNSLISKINR